MLDGSLPDTLSGPHNSAATFSCLGWLRHNRADAFRCPAFSDCVGHLCESIRSRPEQPIAAERTQDLRCSRLVTTCTASNTAVARDIPKVHIAFHAGCRRTAGSECPRTLRADTSRGEANPEHAVLMPGGGMIGQLTKT